MPYNLPSIILTNTDKNDQEINLEKLDKAYPPKEKEQRNKLRDKKYFIMRAQHSNTITRFHDYSLEVLYSKRLNDFNIIYTEEELSGYLKSFFMKRNELLQDYGFFSWFLHSNISQAQVEAFPTKHRQILALLKYALKPPRSALAGEKNRTFLVFEALQWIEGEPSNPRVCIHAPEVFHKMLQIVKMNEQLSHKSLNSRYPSHHPTAVAAMTHMGRC